MGLFDKIKTKTVEETVTTVVDTAKGVVREGLDDKVKGALYLLPIAATALLVFRGDDNKKSGDIPTKQIINNYYYYGERQVKPRDSNDCKGCK